MRLPVAMTVAGSDSGGGAGIEADLKTFAALGCHGTCAITAITAQNTLGVDAIEELSPAIVTAQIDSVFADLPPRAVKTGMLASPEIIFAVTGALRAHHMEELVVDPVMVAKGGAKLLRDDAMDALKSELLPLARLITPNLPEAELLLGRGISSRPERQQAAIDLVRSLGCRAALVKGGHAQDGADDVLFDGRSVTWFTARRIDTPNTHGSGCTYSSAISAGLARGLELEPAIRAGKRFITQAIRWSLEMGGGHGPVNPLFRLRAPLARKLR
ncbi:MAG TPA: bifunctional hydroxymethylpyrimidine kinase/phosphomethylpyrimidine kinase [Candidatus Acidoferrales bacterium]|nr:bifunctional hydroxymethylpyrimidine kinase/phosphomethylpyrimidine kinase [Candidatus Acidoferrales bacterium]